MNPTYSINSDVTDLSTIAKILDNDGKIELTSEAVQRINNCRSYLDEKLKNNPNQAIYGINTGFGALHDKSISNNELSQLQHNLILSHACGIGDRVPDVIVKLMLLLKVEGLAQGHSGVQLDTVQGLINLFNNNLLPVVYEQGSLGASGDLAPLAHLCLPLLGEGKLMSDGLEKNSKDVLNEYGWSPLTLKSKEGLALLNGTQFMSAYATWSILQARRLAKLSDVIGAISLDAFHGHLAPFDTLVHQVRPHKGQLETANNIKQLLAGSEISKLDKQHVQDPYSFRCIPQVHGACKDLTDQVEKTVVTEINAVTDNPTIFPEADKIISAGNFHGQPMAFALDTLALAVAELGSISERRIYKLISGQRELPPFLVANPGLNSGFMIPQYTAASIVSQNKQLCTPASVDTIDSSNGQEDHVSMGANAATKCRRIVENLEKVLAIELYTASQALEFRRPHKSSAVLEDLIVDYRKVVPFVTNDRLMHHDIVKSIDFVKALDLTRFS